MAEILGKTLGSLQSLISGNTTNDGKSNTVISSRKFKNFVENFRCMSTKDEEIRFMRETINILRKCFSRPGVRIDDLQVYLAESVICEMFGYSVPFAHIHAIKLAENSNFFAKRMGYLAARFFFKSDQELLLLLINTLVKDLRSPNIIEVNMAIVVVAELIQGEMVSTVLQAVEERLRHFDPSVRKKALYCIQTISRKSVATVRHIIPQLMKMLSDTDHSVMMAAYHALFHFIKEDPSKFNHILPNVIQIQEQIIRNKFPSEYNYDDVSAPWFQILLLQIIRELGKENPASVSVIQSLLVEMLQQSGTKKYISFGIMHECISTIAVIDVNQELIELALTSITLLLRSQDTTLRYIGLDNLTKMVIKVQNCFDSKHQPAILECLQHPDVSIQLKTFDLIYELCNEKNVVVIVGKYLEFLQPCHDPHQQDVMVNKIFDLANKFSPSFLWYLSTVEKVLVLEFARPKPSQMKTIFRNLKKVSSRTISKELCVDIVQQYIDKCTSCENMTPSYIQLSTWIFKEFGHLCPSDFDEKILQALCNMLVLSKNKETVLISLLSCVLEYVLHLTTIPPQIKDFVAKFEAHPKFLVRQFAQEIERCITAHDKLKELDICNSAFNHKIEFDPFLSDQDEYVIASLKEGSKPYMSRSLIVNPSLSVDDICQADSIEVSTTLDLRSESVKSNDRSIGSLSSSCGARATSYLATSSEKKFIWTKEGLQTLESLPKISDRQQKSEVKNDLFAGVGMTNK